MSKDNRLSNQSNFWSNLFKSPAEKSEMERLLFSMPPFQNLNHKDLALLMHIMHNRVYTANEYIFYQGDPGIALYIVQDGEVVFETTYSEGITHKVAHYKRGDFFGELAMLEDEKRFASAIAVRDSRLAVIFKPDLDEFVQKYPKKGIKILHGISQIFASRLRKLNEDYVSLYIKNLNSTKELQHGSSN